MTKKYTLIDLEAVAERMIRSEDMDAIDLCDNLGQLYDNVKHTDWFKRRLMEEVVTNHIRYPKYVHLEGEFYVWQRDVIGESCREKANIGTYGITDDDEPVEGLWYPPLDVEFKSAYQLSCGYVEGYMYENLNTILFQEHQQYAVQQFLRVNHASRMIQEKIFDIEDGYSQALDFFILISGVRWLELP